MVGLLPLLPTVVVPPAMIARERGLGKRFARFLAAMHLTGEQLRAAGHVTGRPQQRAPNR
jgi:hypothetical protein